MDRLISVLLATSLTCLLVVYSGCSGGAPTNNLADIITPTPSPGPSPSPSPSPSPTPSPTPGSGTDTSFYVGVDTSISDSAYVHLSTSFSTNCSIESSVTSNKDIACYVEMPEADVFYRDLPLVFHVPASMCKYLVRGTYWFYNEETGIGPTSLNISTSKTITEDASGTQTVTFATAHDCTVNGVFDADCDNQKEVTSSVNSSTGGLTVGCVYDRSAETNKHNCCLGKVRYTRTTTTTLIQPSGTTVTSGTTIPEDVEWGGSVGDCIGGPGRADWGSYDVNGYPIYKYQNVEDGLTDTYTIKNPNSLLEIDLSSDAPVRSLQTANFYSVAASTDHTHSGYVSVTTSVKPYFIDPIDDRDGDTLKVPNDAYDFVCLDEGYEIIHRIRIYVREWDTRADYNQYIATSGVTAVPDRRNQSAPVDCEGLWGPCDDFSDNDDFLNLDLNLSAYDTSNPLTRDQNFPYLIYK